MSGSSRKKGARPSPPAPPPSASAVAKLDESNAARIAAMQASSAVTVKPAGPTWPAMFSGIGDALGSLAREAASPGSEEAEPAKGLASGRVSSAGLVGRLDHSVDLWDLFTGSFSGRVGVADGAVHVGASVGSRDGRTEERSGAGAGAVLKSDSVSLSAGHVSVQREDEKGAVLDGSSCRVAIGDDGVKLAGSRTRNGNSAGATMGTNEAGDVTGGLSGKHASGVSGSVGATVGDHRVGGKLGAGVAGGGFKGSASVSFQHVDDKEIARFASPGTGGVDGLAAGWFGQDAVSLGLRDAFSLGGSAGLERGPAGLSISGYEADSATTRFHTTAAAVLAGYDAEAMAELAGGLRPVGPIAPGLDPSSLETMDEAGLKALSTKHPKLFSAYLESRFAGQVEQARSFEDLDLDSLQAGQAFSYESGEASGVSGRASVYCVGASLGTKSQNIEQLAIGKDAKGRTQVRLTAMDETAASVGLDLAKALTVDEEDRKGSLSAVEFSVDDSEAGKQALAEFQETGLLPGARDALAGDRRADEAFADLERKRTELESLDWMLGLGIGSEDTLVDDPEAAPFQGTIPQITVAEQRRRLRAEVVEKSGAVNKAMLDKRSWDLSKVRVPGVEFTSHRLLDSDSRTASLGLLGWELMKWGTSFTEWEEHYRSEGRDQTEYGGTKREENILDPDERSRIVTNPRDGYGMELGMFTEQPMNKRERSVLERLPNSGLRPGMMGAWADGDYRSGALARLSLAMTGEQLDTMRDAFQPEEDFWAHAARQTDEHQFDLDHPLLRTADEETRNACRRDPDPFRVVEARQAAFSRALESQRTGGILDRLLDAEVERREDSGELFVFGLQVQDEMLANIAGVQSGEDFKALGDNEQGMAIASYVIRAVDAKGGDPWQAAHMVLAIDDPEVRDHHMRTLFMTYERATEGANAAVDFVGWVQRESERAGLGKDQADMLLAGAQLDIADKGERKARNQIEEKGADQPETADMVADRLVKETAEVPASDDPRMRVWGTVRKQEADDASDWLQAADRAGGTELVDRAVRRAAEKNPRFLGDFLGKVGTADPGRAELTNEILAESPYVQAQVEQTFSAAGDAVEGFARSAAAAIPWWAGPMKED